MLTDIPLSVIFTIVLKLIAKYLPIYLAVYFAVILLGAVVMRLSHRLYLDIQVEALPEAKVPEQLRQLTEKLRLVAESQGYIWLNYYCIRGLASKLDVVMGVFNQRQHPGVTLTAQAFVTSKNQKIRNKKSLILSCHAFFQDGSSLSADNSLLNFSSFDSKMTAIKCPGAEPAELVDAFESALAETPRSFKEIKEDGEFTHLREEQRRSIERMIEQGAYKLSADGKSAIPGWKFIFSTLLKNHWPFSYFFRIRTAVGGEGKNAEVERINPHWSDSL